MSAVFELIKIIVGGLATFALMGYSVWQFFLGDRIFVLGVFASFGLFYALKQYINKLEEEGVFY